MSLRNILVAFNGSDGAIAALRHATALAREKGAHVTALLAHARHEAVDSHAAWVPPKAREIIARASADLLAQAEARFVEIRESLDLGERLHFLRAKGRVDAVLAECARSFDLLVVGQDPGDTVDEHVALHPDRIALLSGRPVLIVSRDHAPGTRQRDIAIAWDGSRASARALSDSLHLLIDDEEVSVLTVGERELPRPVSDVLEHLARHGIAARHQALPGAHGVARALLDHCASESPGLLVMGAYEHSKFREDFLGGVTAPVLREIRIPVLLSH